MRCPGSCERTVRACKQVARAWRGTREERWEELIRDLELCQVTDLHEFYVKVIDSTLVFDERICFSMIFRSK